MKFAGSAKPKYRGIHIWNLTLSGAWGNLTSFMYITIRTLAAVNTTSSSVENVYRHEISIGCYYGPWDFHSFRGPKMLLLDAVPPLLSPASCIRGDERRKAASFKPLRPHHVHGVQHAFHIHAALPIHTGWPIWSDD